MKILHKLHLRIFLLSLIVFFSFSTVLFAQSSADDNAPSEVSEISSLDKLYRGSFFIGGVYEGLGIDKQHTVFGTWDDSNDFFFFDDTISKASNIYGISLGWEALSEKYFFGIDGAFSRKGKSSLYTFNIGLGRTIPVKNMLMVPKLMVGFGNSKTRLGEMDNWDIYIEIDETLFYGTSVDVNLKTSLLQLTPQLDFYIPIGNKGNSIRASLGYKLGKPIKERVEYDGYEDEEDTESLKRHRPLNHEKHRLLKDGETIIDGRNGIFEKLDMVKFSGLKIQLGLKF